MRPKCEPELRRNHHLVTHRSEPFAYHLFVYERTVNLSRIEECDAQFDRSPHNRNHLLFGSRYWAVAFAHPHAAQADGRDFQVASSKFAFLHRFSFGALLPMRMR